MKRTRFFLNSACLGIAALLLLLSAEPCHAQDKPVHHIVLFKFKETTSPSEIQAISKSFSELAGRVSGLRGFQWGRNDSPEGLDRGFTHAFILTFENKAALDAYGPSDDHQRFVERALPFIDQTFVYDFEVDALLPASEPGRTHHLVFFKYKEGTTAESLARIVQAFRDLEAKIPGLLSVQTGPDVTPQRHRQGFQHAFWLTLANSRARDAYLPHPAHKAFVEVLRPHLAEPFVVDFTVRPSAHSLFITEGLEPYRVYQRDENDVATIKFSGIAAEDGAIEARLVRGRRTVSGFDWREVGQARGGEFAASLEGVPVGGEYTVEVRRRDRVGNVAEHAEVANIIVGDLWILAGQSNMEGWGDLKDVEEPHPLVHCFTMGHRWELAVEPLHYLADSPDPVHSGLADSLDPALSRGPLARAKNEEERRRIREEIRSTRVKGAGLGLPFAKELVRRTGVPIGLIASAHGGTSMTQWDPALRDRGGASLYGSMLAQVKNAGGKVRGVLWYQGESDANADAAPRFAERFKKLVEAFRADFGEGLPFYYVQIGRFVVDGASSQHWDAIQELQRQAESEIRGVAMVPAIDLPLDDLIHVGTNGLKRLGARLAKIADRELFGNTSIERGPRLESVVSSPTDNTIRVRFANVNGRLSPADDIKGFSLTGADTSTLRIIFNARVDPDAPSTVILELQRPLPDGAQLWYGRGLDPVCELVDDEDMAVPVFGPVAIEK